MPLRDVRWRIAIVLLALAMVLVVGGCGVSATPTPTRVTGGATATVAPASGGATPTRLASGLATVAPKPTTAAGTVSQAGDAVTIIGLVQHAGPLTVEQAMQLGSESVDVQFQSSKGTEQHRYTGVRLWDVLQHVGLQLDTNRKNDQLRKYVVVTAKDGYEVVIGLGEIDPNFGARPVLLAWEEDGTRLAGDRGPFRLVVPGDVRGGRYVTGVVRIEVRDIDSPPRSS